MIATSMSGQNLGSPVTLLDRKCHCCLPGQCRLQMSGPINQHGCHRDRDVCQTDLADILARLQMSARSVGVHFGLCGSYVSPLLSVIMAGLDCVFRR